MSDKTKTDAQPQPAQPAQPQNVTVNLVQPDRSAEGARAVLEGRALEMDKTVAGGKYEVGGVLVNADGVPLKNDKG